MKTYDVVVIGTGTAGQTAAFDLSKHGHTVAVIERSSEPGGVCALHGCQSKKYFYEAAEAVAKCRHLLGKGITDVPKASWREVLVQKNKFTADIPEKTVKNLKSAGMDYYQGEAFFTGPSTVAAGGEEIEGRFIVIAAGAEPVHLPIEGSEHMITSNAFLALDHLPQSIAFVGGGFIAFEFAHFAVRLGGRPGHVHILEARDKVLGPFDRDLVRELTAASTADGIVIHTGAGIREIVKKAGQFQVTDESASSLEVDLVVNAAGRQAPLDAMNLDAGGIEWTEAGITVDGTMQTSNPAVFAVGDCAATVQLARVADMEARTAARAIRHQLGGKRFRHMDYTTVPSVLFTYPQLGMVGKTESQLRQEDIGYRKSTDTRLRWPTYRRTGLVHAAYKILVDNNGRILGAHFLSDNATGLVSAFTQAMRAGTPVDEVHENAIMSPYPSRESDMVYMLSSLLD